MHFFFFLFISNLCYIAFTKKKYLIIYFVSFSILRIVKLMVYIAFNLFDEAFGR
jgi:hypothetical protein